jgi:nucleoid-associated protein YgaU
MTRETKIGLLVGLAFIIVIGILLSDHLTSSTEPPPATLANAGSNVMQTVNSPGGAHVPAVTSGAAAQPQNVTPNQPVPTSADLTPRPQPMQIVQIGPGSGAAAQQQPPLPITVQGPSQSQAQANAQQATPAPPVITLPQQPADTAPHAPVAQAPQAQQDDSPVITQVPTSVERSLSHAAQQGGEQLVALDASGRPAPNQAPASWGQALTGMREHKAEPGDSVSRMAARYLGGNTKVNRDLIVRANPSLQNDPNKVIVGKTYMIPTVADSAPAVTNVAAAPQQAQQDPFGQSQAPQQQSDPPAVASATEYFYTVREGDSLWKIANDQLGKPGAVAAIKELNKDTLRGGDTVYVGMKLKMPGKPLAQAN